MALLYGGWTDWTEKNLPVSKEIPRIVPQPFIYSCDCRVLATANYILAHLGDPNVAIVDCRPPQEFLGLKKHPKAKVAGRIPGARLVMVEGAGHGFAPPHRQTLDSLLAEFLGEHGPTAAQH